MILSPFVGSVLLSIAEPDVIGNQAVCLRLKSCDSCYLGLVFHSVASLAHIIKIGLVFI